MATVNSEQSVEISPWLSCRSPVLLSTDNTCSLSEFLHVGSGLRWADGPSGAVTKVLTGQAGAGAARRGQRNRFIGVRDAVLRAGEA
jgi:hypothetical protein